MKRTSKTIIFAGLILAVALGGCTLNGTEPEVISGYLSANQVTIAPELSARITEVTAAQGSKVKAGDVLMTQDISVYQAQLTQADAAVKAGEAALQAAESQLAAARINAEIASQAARMQQLQSGTPAWTGKTADDYQPGWYYTRTETLNAARDQVSAAQASLDSELAKLQAELDKSSSQEFVNAERRLILAQAALDASEKTLAQAKLAVDNDDLEKNAQDTRDSADAELQAARKEYDRLAGSAGAKDIIDARVRVTVARQKLEDSKNTLMALQTGDDSVQVQAANAAVNSAATMVEQAKAGIEQANAAKALAQLQLDKATVNSPIDGTVLTVNVKAGEIIPAGGNVMTIANLDTLELIVYLPEDQYGQVKLDQTVKVTTDSFGAREFTGKVVYIADEAEFTPRSVQTQQARKMTVYAVKIQVENPNHDLKPGMPADVKF